MGRFYSKKPQEKKKTVLKQQDPNGTTSILSDNTGMFLRKEAVNPPLSRNEVRFLHEKIEESLRLTRLPNTKTLPGHFSHDLFRFHLEKLENLNVDRGKNPSKIRLINKLHNPNFNIITENDFLASFLFTRSIQKVLYNYINTQQNGEELLKILVSVMDGDDLSDEQISVFSEMMADLDKKEFQGQLENAAENAQEDLESIKDSQMSSKWSNDCSDISIAADILSIIDKIKTLNMSSDSVAKFLKKVLDKALNYFSKKIQIVEQDLLDSSEFDEISDIVEFVDPELFNALALTETIIDNKPTGKINLYIDCSGSMGNEKYSDSPIVLAKATAIKLMNMGYVSEVYLFESYVKETPLKTPIEIMKSSLGGGTCFNSVVEHVDKIGKNALVITDGECKVDIYDEKIYWIGINGSDLRSFKNTESGTQYIKKAQCAYYDGDQMHMINKDDQDNN